MALLPERLPLRPALAASVLLGGGLVAGELLHGLGGSLGLVAVAGLGLWLLQGRGRKPLDRLPSSPEGLLSHCRELLQQFEALDLPVAPRQGQLEALLALGERQECHVGLVGASPSPEFWQLLQQQLKGRTPVLLHQAEPFPGVPGQWCWPEHVLHWDQVIYLLGDQASAADLRWLQAAPADLPLVLISNCEAGLVWEQRRLELQAQLGDSRPLVRIGESLGLQAFALERQRRKTQLRCLRQLQGQWQGLLEQARRARLQPLVLRSQWLVAAAVFASPLPSADLLLVTAVNGLLLKEMAALWHCQWTGEQLQAAALELGRTALGLGALEWGSQALAGLLKLHGATWLVGGSLQALAAAYFTRVVARSMADYLALAAGVPEAELPVLRQQLPLLVARASEAERLDWQGFANQAQQWLRQQQPLLKDHLLNAPLLSGPSRTSANFS